MHFRLLEKQADREKRTTHRDEDDRDSPALMPSSKRIKHSETTTEKRHRTHNSSLDEQKYTREHGRQVKAKHKDSESSSTKKNKYVYKEDEVTRETNWLSSNLRVRIVDQNYKKGRYYNTKVH